MIPFYSRNGVAEKLALAVAEGARAAGAKIRLRRVADIVSLEIMSKAHGWRENSERMIKEYGIPNEADAEWADGIIFSTPTRSAIPARS